LAEFFAPAAPAASKAASSATSAIPSLARIRLSFRWKDRDLTTRPSCRVVSDGETKAVLRSCALLGVFAIFDCEIGRTEYGGVVLEDETHNAHAPFSEA
jgi:hypothetical protein